MQCTTCLAKERLDPASEAVLFQSSFVEAGAVVTFVGLTRATTAGGTDVVGIFLEHHPRLTERSLRDIAEHAARKFDVAAIRVVHRCGSVPAGEPIVFVAVAALHRRAAFEAAEYAMDRLKTDAVFWKREDAVDGSRWIEPTTVDYYDRARWSE